MLCMEGKRSFELFTFNPTNDKWSFLPEAQNNKWLLIKSVFVPLDGALN